MTVGPDAARYLHAGGGGAVPRPFHLRWLLPAVCGRWRRRWWIVWAMSWPLLAVSMFAWQSHLGASRALAATVLLVALPGILGPSAVVPVGVDLPASALTLAACAAWQWSPPLAVVLLVLAAATKETAPVFAAVWMWSWWPLAVLVVPLVAMAVRRTGADPLGAEFQAIADHPLRASLVSHRGRWRDGWLMVAPWGVCLAALWRPSWQLAVAAVVAYGVLLVATDTVRLVQHAAAPVFVAGAAAVIPVGWLLPACVVHACWWWQPERV